MDKHFTHEGRTLIVHIDMTMGDWQISILDEGLQRVDFGGLSVPQQQTLNREGINAALDGVVADVRSGKLALRPPPSA